MLASCLLTVKPKQSEENIHQPLVMNVYTVNEGERMGQQPNKMFALDRIYFHLNTFDNINNCVCVQYSTVVYSVQCTVLYSVQYSVQ